MGKVLDSYKNIFIKRFNKDKAIPYYSARNFKGLNCKEFTFKNNLDNTLYYFEYSYDNFNKEKVVFFLPGIGPGHTAYLAEIESICRLGYKVITLDYTGCDKSEGKTMVSINQPTRDAQTLLNLLDLKEKVILIGHSLGAYTALNLVHINSYINNAIIISGFININSLMKSYLKFNFLIKKVVKFENEIYPELVVLDNWDYLRQTKDNLLFIQSIDDEIVNFKNNLGDVTRLKNPRVKSFICSYKKHNPTLTEGAIIFMNKTMGDYYKLIRKGQLKTIEDRCKYFEDKPIERMTAQDPKIRNIIGDFISEI